MEEVGAFNIGKQELHGLCATFGYQIDHDRRFARSPGTGLSGLIVQEVRTVNGTVPSWNALNDGIAANEIATGHLEPWDNNPFANINIAATDRGFFNPVVHFKECLVAVGLGLQSFVECGDRGIKELFQWGGDRRQLTPRLWVGAQFFLLGIAFLGNIAAKVVWISQFDSYAVLVGFATFHREIDHADNAIFRWRQFSLGIASTASANATLHSHTASTGHRHTGSSSHARFHAPGRASHGRHAARATHCAAWCGTRKWLVIVLIAVEQRFAFFALFLEGFARFSLLEAILNLGEVFFQIWIHAIKHGLRALPINRENCFPCGGHLNLYQIQPTIVVGFKLIERKVAVHVVVFTNVNRLVLGPLATGLLFSTFHFHTGEVRHLVIAFRQT